MAKPAKIAPLLVKKRQMKDLFNLNSSDEEFGMTHAGKNLDDMDGDEISRFKGVLDDTEGDLDPEYVSKLNFSGFQEDEGTEDKSQVKKTR